MIFSDAQFRRQEPLKRKQPALKPAALKTIVIRSVADANILVMPAAVIGVRHAAVFEPAAWRWRLFHVITRAIIAVGDRATDQAADDTGSKAAGDNAAVVAVAMVMKARRRASAQPFSIMWIWMGVIREAGASSLRPK